MKILSACILAAAFLIAVPALAAVPDQVENVKVPKSERKSNQVKVTWDEADGATEYIAKVKTRKGKVVATKKTSNTYAYFKPLKKYKKYKVGVRAKNADGKGAVSKKVKFRTKKKRFFHSNKHGFNITFPKTWKKFKVVKKKENYGSPVGNVWRYDFKLPSANAMYYPNGWADLIVVSVYSHSQWDYIEANWPISIGAKQLESDDYVMDIGHAQDASPDMAERLMEFDDIADTFSLD